LPYGILKAVRKRYLSKEFICPLQKKAIQAVCNNIDDQGEAAKHIVWYRQWARI